MDYKIQKYSSIELESYCIDPECYYYIYGNNTIIETDFNTDEMNNGRIKIYIKYEKKNVYLFKGLPKVISNEICSYLKNDFIKIEVDYIYPNYYEFIMADANPFYRLISFEKFTSESDEESDLLYYRMIKNYNKKFEYSWDPLTLNSINIIEFHSNLINFIYMNF